MRLFIFFFLFFALSLHAQEPSICNQNFKGVKSVKLYTSETDSAGKVLAKKTLSEEHFYDSSGKETRILYYDKGVHYRSDDYIFDSLGRKTMRILWTKKDGNTKFIYTYEQKGQFTIVRETSNKKITRTESNYWDTLQNRYIERAWYGESTMGAPPYMHEYNKEGKLVMSHSNNGFTEYRYDSLGTLTYMLIRQFEDGHCSGYSPFHYETVYSGNQLVQYNAKWFSMWFSYNNRGLISTEKRRTDDVVYVTEAEYVFY